MKLVVNVYNTRQLQISVKYADAVVLMVPDFSLIYEDDFDINSAIELCRNNNVEIILGINRLFLENELNDLEEIIDKYSCYKFYVHDLGVVQILKDRGLINNVILDASTMICNSLDSSNYSSLGFDGVSISSEIPFTDIQKIIKQSPNIFAQIFGRKLMFYSRRKLLSLYKEKSKVSFNNTDLKIKEEKRDELMPIFENKYGYYVFRSYYISLLNEINKIGDLRYGFVESITLSLDELNTVLGVYKDAIEGKTDIKELSNTISDLSLDINDGFLYSDSIHKKEKIINE